MKKLLLATLVSALSITAAHAAPKVYGKLFVSTDYVNVNGTDIETYNLATDTSTFTTTEDAKTAQVGSNASRFGVKGEDELTPTLSAVYQIEWGVDATDGGTLTNRNRFLGLKHNDFGTIKWGQFDTAVKESQNKIDLFNDLLDSPKSGAPLDMKSVLAGEERVTNVIAYESPEMEGLPVKVTANLVMDETPHNSDNGLALSVAYDQNGVYTAIAGSKKVQADFAALGYKDVASDVVRLVGQVDLGKLNVVDGLVLGALYQTAETSDKDAVLDNEKGYLLSASYALPNVEGWKVFGQASGGTTSLTVDVDDLKRQQYGLGVAYAYSKNTNVYGYVAQQKFDTVKIDLTKGTVTGSLDAKTNVVGLALEHKF